MFTSLCLLRICSCYKNSQRPRIYRSLGQDCIGSNPAPGGPADVDPSLIKHI